MVLGNKSRLIQVVEPIRLGLYGLPAELDNNTLNKTGSMAL